MFSEVLKRLSRAVGLESIEDPNDIGTGTDDIYVLDLDAVLRRLVQDGHVISLGSEEDDMEQEELDNG